MRHADLRPFALVQLYFRICLNIVYFCNIVQRACFIFIYAEKLDL